MVDETKSQVAAQLVPLTAAERQRRYRARSREGLTPARAEVPVPVVDGLIDTGLLAVWGENDPHAVGEALVLASQNWLNLKS